MTRFLISSFVDHRHLHSFPTRRSSDLLTYNKEFNHISETLNQKLDSAKKRKLVGADVHYKQFYSPVFKKLIPGRTVTYKIGERQISNNDSSQYVLEKYKTEVLGL